MEAARAHGRQDGTAGVGHHPQALKPAHPLLVELGPWTPGLTWPEALHGDPIHLLVRAVNPAEAQGFFYGVKVGERIRIRRAATLEDKPALGLGVGMFCKPGSEHMPVGDISQDVSGL